VAPGQLIALRLSWRPPVRVTARATPIALPSHPIYVLNMSVTSDAAAEEVVELLRGPLLPQRLREGMEHA